MSKAATVEPPTRRRAPARSGAVVAGGCALSLAALLGYVLLAGDRVYALTGDSYPGLVTAAADVLGYFLASLVGAVCLGGLLYVVVTARPDVRGVIDAGPFRTHVLVERASVGWVLVAAAMVVVQAASDSGASALRLLGSGGMVDAVLASQPARAWIVVALAAASIAVTVRLSLSWTAHVVLLLPAAIAVVAVPVNGNPGVGPDHDYATSAVIVFAVLLAAWAGTAVANALHPVAEPLARRVSTLQAVLGPVVLAYGAGLLGLLAGGDLVDGPYGQAGVAAAVLMLVVWLGSLRALRRGRPWAATSSAVALTVVLALIAVMATQPAPRLLDHRFTAWDVFLGYALPDPPSVARILTVWRFDVFLGCAAIVMALAYVAGYVRLRRRGDRWSTGRLVAWLAGCLLLLFTTGSGVRAYGSAMFSVHMAEHMTLNMFVPVLLVLGGPVTLALRTLPAARPDEPPGPREWVMWLVHSKLTAVLAQPVVAFVLFVASLYAVYFTPIFDTLVRYHWGHELMSVHFLLVGYLFFWGIIGVDPGPRKLPFLGRLGLLFAVMPFHAFFGIATMTTASIIGGRFYHDVGLPWLANVHDDQHLGGAIAWGSSELPVILVVVALVAQWARQDRRAATRSDRHADADYADDDLDAYNAMLRELARSRRGD
ncbi:hypothetical protein MMAD_11850 [Mycolicibacterium madagascariense]|uniref:ABC transporter permease n=1 Tax=Mycolicibacterium madagascariense TaxID=212765 RepID=A0A7I7XC99_9MYCO|nr:cytochrome c oxidase assembly protein [Mycolicibacterium madagascariense]MCV7014985.1 cytochrome c oxidase assembly protein [Mycolicibacterium madagascariense]BBZ26890.1 hypothetical protein MMAD_11850 [Mycolicibacterium madagascariense]